MKTLHALLIVAGLTCCMNAACVFSSATALKPASPSVPRLEVIQPVTPAALDDAAMPVPNEPATVSDEATTAEAHDAVEPEAVSLTSPDELKNTPTNFNAPIPAPVAVYSRPIAAQGRYVLTSRPTYGRFGRFTGYQQVWVWQGPSYQYQRPTYRYYGNCANGVCR